MGEYKEITQFIQSIYPKDKISLHEPILGDHEKKYLIEAIDCGFVSSVGPHVQQFEKKLAKMIGVPFIVSVVNGTSALHAALKAVDVMPGDLVLTQAVSFVATANAISYAGAEPIFIDSDGETLGLSPQALQKFLEKNATKKDSGAILIKNKKRISACVPMHVFGNVLKIEELIQICNDWKIKVVEDAAEALGSKWQGRHLGTFGDLGVLSFNGNKIVTTGGGGAILVKDEKLAARIRHSVTTAKKPHGWKFYHDEVGFNYRLPNINAALGCAQLDQLESFLEKKAIVFKKYKNFFAQRDDFQFHIPTNELESNYWLNTIFAKSLNERDEFLEYSNAQGINCRPIWELLSNLPMYNHCMKDELIVAQQLSDSIINLPSGVPA